jgi:Leucine-rich repeat (LRR) protein
LTDAIMDQLWQHFKHISTLNVAQNHLSEKSIESLINHKAHMPNLRSVVLSQNLIK